MHVREEEERSIVVKFGVFLLIANRHGRSVSFIVLSLLRGNTVRSSWC